jgi:uncharacterized membrane protein (DUF106 family)
LVVNVVLSAAAITGLVQLLPYHLSQQAKLREVQERVKTLHADFGRANDPGQAMSVMREQSAWVDPTQRQIVWQDGSTKDDN